MDAPEGLLLAIDQGTSAVKVVIFDLSGRMVTAAGDETLVRHPRPTWMESDAESWWRSVASCIRTVLAHPEVRADGIRAIGICGFMHTLVPIDAQGSALCPPLLWPDQRCAPEAAALAAHTDLITRITGRPLTTLSSVPRLLWLRRHRPEVLAKAHAFLLPKDFLRYRLTGEIATDARDAGGTGLLDPATGSWSEDLLGLVDIASARLPPIRRPDEVAGAVTPLAAAATGLRAGTPVIIGSGDWFTTIVGSGCCLPERSCLYLGTAGIMGAFTSPEEQDCLGRTHYFGSVTATGSALRWVRNVFDGAQPVSEGAPALTYAQICEEAEASGPGARGLLFLPHLMGERGGRMRPEARGVFYGLTLAHRRADFFRAVLEGTALWMRATMDPHIRNQPVHDLVLFGGGAQSRLWRRIVAAVYQRRLLLPETVEGGALGAAMLAAVGTGLRRGYRSLAAEWVRITGVEEPDLTLVEQYAEIYRDFQELEEQCPNIGRFASASSV